MPLMLKNRLCPPPRETYSIHRKLSGFILLFFLFFIFYFRSVFIEYAIEGLVRL